MNTKQAAYALNTTPRRLRRILRSNPELAQVSTSGFYQFTPELLNQLRSMITTPKPVDPPELEWLNQTPGFTPAQVRDPRMKRAILEQRKARQQRLDKRLKELTQLGELTAQV